MRCARKANKLTVFAKECRNTSHFSKHGKTRWGFPLFVQIQTQSLCNGNCTICPYPVVKDNNEQGQMDERLYRKIADEAAQAKHLQSFTFMLQNEPLIDTQLCDRISYFKQRNSHTETNLVTNGMKLDSSMVERLILSGLDILIVSLNAANEETYKHINI